MFTVNGFAINSAEHKSKQGHLTNNLFGQLPGSAVDGETFTVNGTLMSAKPHVSKTSGSVGFYVHGKVDNMQVGIYVTLIGSAPGSKAKKTGNYQVSGNVTVITAK